MERNLRDRMNRKRKRIEAAVWVNPGRQGGTPCVFGTRITTRMVADYMHHGSYDDLLYGYDLTRGQILVACWYEADHGAYKKQWGDWVEANFSLMWKSNWKSVPNPPLREAS